MAGKVYKKSSKTRKWRRPKTSVPRPVSEANKIYKFARMGSSNANATNPLALQIRTDSVTGRPSFSNGITSGSNLQLRFGGLTTVDVYLNGLSSAAFDIPSSSEFRNMFEEYRLDRVDIMVLPTMSEANITTGIGASQLPWIVYSGDTTDNDGENSLELMQKADAKFSQMINGVTPGIKKTVVPCSGAQMAGSGTNTSVLRGQWMSTAAYNCPHWGFKMALDNSYNGYNVGVTICQMNIIVKYHMSFRGLK